VSKKIQDNTILLCSGRASGDISLQNASKEKSPCSAAVLSI